MDLKDKCFQSVCSTAREAAVLHSAADALEWDERTRMPPMAGEYRATQIATLRAQVHQRRTSPQYGQELCELADAAVDLDPSSDLAATIRELLRDWNRDSKLPTSLVKRLAEATVVGQQQWDLARKADDFSMFRPTLEKIIDLKQEVGQRLSEGTSKSAYECLLDEYEPDARVADLVDIFEQLRAPLVELIQKIADSPQQPNVEILQRDFPVDQQRDFSRKVAEAVGFDFRRGRLDETSHPFCTTLGPHDCRILTRYETNWLPSGLFGTLHEAGHGMYEQGLRSDWFGLPPGSYASLGIHESQSRLWENQVGRSRSFWDWLFSDARTHFPEALAKIELDEFYFAINTVRPSLIRVEADEATYNLHILIRFELEKRLIDGSLPCSELPDAWNDRYVKDLGIEPPSDADGVLQDVHWSAGLFGYFPTYTLGNLYAAQLFDAAARQLGDIDDLFAKGDFRPLLEWLQKNVHGPGRTQASSELVERVTEQSISAESLVSYLEDKFSPLYGI